MTGSDSEEVAILMRQARKVALIIAGTMVLWLGAGWLGGKMGWDPRVAFLFDLAAIAAFCVALMSTWRIKRKLARK